MEIFIKFCNFLELQYKIKCNANCLQNKGFGYSVVRKYVKHSRNGVLFIDII